MALGRRPDQLRQQHSGRLSPRWLADRPHPQGGQPGRLAGRPSHQVRAGDQSQHRQGTRAYDSTEALIDHRRGDRIGRNLLRCTLVANGTWLAIPHLRHLVVMRSEERT